MTNEDRKLEERPGLLKNPWFVLFLIGALALYFALDAPDIWRLAGIPEGKQ